MSQDNRARPTMKQVINKLKSACESGLQGMINEAVDQRAFYSLLYQHEEGQSREDFDKNKRVVEEQCRHKMHSLVSNYVEHHFVRSLPDLNHRAEVRQDFTDILAKYVRQLEEKWTSNLDTSIETRTSSETEIANLDYSPDILLHHSTTDVDSLPAMCDLKTLGSPSFSTTVSFENKENQSPSTPDVLESSPEFGLERSHFMSVSERPSSPPIIKCSFGFHPSSLEQNSDQLDDSNISLMQRASPVPLSVVASTSTPTITESSDSSFAHNPDISPILCDSQQLSRIITSPFAISPVVGDRNIILETSSDSSFA